MLREVALATDTLLPQDDMTVIVFNEMQGKQRKFL